MSKIIFNLEPSTVYDGHFSQIGNNQIRLVMDSLPSESILLSGFVLVNEHNGRIQTNRKDYIYIYKTYEDGKTVELCNNDIPWEKPKTKVKFSTSVGGNLEGETEQTVKNYEELVIPTPFADENYEFVKWNPEIPTYGEIEKDINFVAEFVYVPTEEELKLYLENAKEMKINESKLLLEEFLINNPLVSSCHGGVEAKYTVTSEKQSLMASNYLNYTIAKGVGIEPILTWNSAGSECEVWTEQEYVTLILQIGEYVKPLVSLQQSYEVQIRSCTTQEELDEIEIVYSE